MWHSLAQVFLVFATLGSVIWRLPNSGLSLGFMPHLAAGFFPPEPGKVSLFLSGAGDCLLGLSTGFLRHHVPQVQVEETTLSSS